MKLIEVNEAKFVNDFFKMIVDGMLINIILKTNSILTG